MHLITELGRNYPFQQCRNACPPGQETASKPQNKAEVRRRYLMEKYVWKWKQFMRSRSEGLFPRLLKLGHNNWLRQVRILPCSYSDTYFNCVYWYCLVWYIHTSGHSILTLWLECRGGRVA